MKQKMGFGLSYVLAARLTKDNRFDKVPRGVSVLEFLRRCSAHNPNLYARYRGNVLRNCIPD